MMLSFAVVSARGLSFRGGLLAGLGCLILLVAFRANGLYRIASLAPAQEFRRVISAVSVSVLVLGFATSLFFASAQRFGIELSVTWIVATWFLLLVLVMTSRKVWHAAIHRLRRSGALSYRTLVVGTNPTAREMGRRLRPGSGFSVLGMVAADGESLTTNDGEPPVAGTVAHIDDLLDAWAVECLFVATVGVAPDEMDRLLQTARRRGIEVRVAANLPEILASRLSLQTLGGKLVFALDRVQLSGSQAVAKRAFDLVAGGLLILATLPVWIVASIMVKATSPGPVLFRQRRMGREGRMFTIYKFRTMVSDAESRQGELFSLSNGPLFKVVEDPRLTRVGRVLRRLSVDELPQLLNVMKGDMSLVGPRPLVMGEGVERVEWQRRLEVLPGMTGLWQVSGRSDLSFEECVQLDTFYIENWSISYDLYILLRTVPAVFRRRGAY